MRYHEILDEAVNKREWVFYHGTKSAPFDQFEPSKAAKGEQYWNPLGNGMYVTDQPVFAAYFGPHIHKIVIPPGCNYKRINQRTWISMSWKLVLRALRRAFRSAGENVDQWRKGKPFKFPKNISREQMLAAVNDFYKGRGDDISEKIAALNDDQLRKQCKYIETITPGQVDAEKQKKIQEFEIEARKCLRTNSPYEGLYEVHYLVGYIFSEQINDHFAKSLPELSDEIFGKYDFVVFTDTNDVIGHGKNGASSLEVVIFNPALQKTNSS